MVEVWFDGANGEGPNGKRQQYDWPRIHAAVRRLQPKAVMFSDSGPDVRWIGNETGEAGTTCWSAVDPDRVPRPGFDAPWVQSALTDRHSILRADRLRQSTGERLPLVHAPGG